MLGSAPKLRSVTLLGHLGGRLPTPVLCGALHLCLGVLGGQLEDDLMNGRKVLVHDKLTVSQYASKDLYDAGTEVSSKQYVARLISRAVVISSNGPRRLTW